MDTFYLGTHKPAWLGRLAIPLFVSRRQLMGRTTLPRALGRWALDSGGFSELTLYGEWRTTPRDYVADVRRFSEDIGGMAWAATQDWMCEPFMLAKTGKDVKEHQRLTVENYATLLDMAPEIPWAPVLQGWQLGDYLAHAEAYQRAGLPLDRTVGIGSVCRRQRVGEGQAIVRGVAIATGLPLHGFGLKTTGLQAIAPFLHSADSLAWSYRARRAGQQDSCAHKSCANCPAFAMRWRARLLDRIDATNRQDVLFVR